VILNNNILKNKKNQRKTISNMIPNGVFSRKKELVQATVMLGDLHLNLARNSSGQERSLY
jgi:hypothetical protein